MNEEQYRILAEKILAGTAGDEDISLYNRYYNAYQANYGVWSDLSALERIELLKAAKHGIDEKLQPVVQKNITLWPRVRVAAGIAAAVATIVFGIWFFSDTRSLDALSSRGSKDFNDVLPGKNGATITLSTGEVIQLSGDKKGVIIGKELKYNDSTSVILNGSTALNSHDFDRRDGEPRHLDDRRDPLNGKTKGSLSAFEMTKAKMKSTEMTAQTRRGQSYEFTLPDGTHVQLNADSKISFPSQFFGKERKVLLTGEAFFEVVHDAKMPFRVECIAANGIGQVVEDIGTAFNISAYPGAGSIKTTLVEGEARVGLSSSRAGLSSSRANARDLSNGKRSLAALEMTAGKMMTGEVTLKPNQQSTLQGDKLHVKTIDPETAIAWKDGYFSFKKSRLEEVMQQIERWYDVQVEYENQQLKNVSLSGGASRYDNVSRILNTIENTGVARFKIVGKKIKVMK